MWYWCHDVTVYKFVSPLEVAILVFTALEHGACAYITFNIWLKNMRTSECESPCWWTGDLAASRPIQDRWYWLYPPCRVSARVPAWTKVGPSPSGPWPSIQPLVFLLLPQIPRYWVHLACVCLIGYFYLSDQSKPQRHDTPIYYLEHKLFLYLQLKSLLLVTVKSVHKVSPWPWQNRSGNQK